MPFIAACTYCRIKVRVPDHVLGQSLACPRCQASFTLVPVPIEQGAAHASGTAAAVSSRTPRLVRKKKANASAEPTVVTEQQSLPTHFDMPVPSEPLVRGAIALPNTERPSLEKPDQNAGVVALFLGSMGLLSDSLTFAEFLSIPLSGLGLVIGCAGLWLNKRHGNTIGLHTIGPAVCLIVLLMALMGTGTESSVTLIESEIANPSPGAVNSP